MIKTVAAISLAIAAASPVRAQEASFRSALGAHLAAIDARDSAGFEATLTAGPVLTFVALNGKLTRDRDEFKAQMRDWFADRDWSWSRRELSVSNTASTGVAVFHVDYDDKDAAGKAYRLSYVLALVFAREEGGWRLVHDQNTRLPRE